MIGGRHSLGRATLTSNAPLGAPVTLRSSHPDIVSVPSQFDVQRGCCDDGLWREFYVTTRAVSAPVTVQIGATSGLVTRTVPVTIAPEGGQSPYGGTPRAVPGTIQAEDFDEGGAKAWRTTTRPPRTAVARIAPGGSISGARATPAEA